MLLVCVATSSVYLLSFSFGCWTIFLYFITICRGPTPLWSHLGAQLFHKVKKIFFLFLSDHSLKENAVSKRYCMREESDYLRENQGELNKFKWNRYRKMSGCTMRSPLVALFLGVHWSNALSGAKQFILHLMLAHCKKWAFMGPHSVKLFHWFSRLCSWFCQAPCSRNVDYAFCFVLCSFQYSHYNDVTAATCFVPWW